MNKKTMSVVVTIVCFASVLVLYLSSPVKPETWYPDPFLTWEDIDSKNDIPMQSINDATVVPVHADGPEDIAFDEDGNMYTGLANGDILKFSPNQSLDYEVIHNTGGRPLGMRLDPKGHLIVADAIKGLLKINLNNKTQFVLADSYKGAKLRFVDHLSIASNGDIYFSDASQRYGMQEYVLDFVEASRTGRIFKWSSQTQQTTLLMEGLYFANGVALSKDEDFLLVNETGQARILQYWLNGERRGNTDVFIASLPGLPDNIYRDSNNHYWVGLVTRRDSLFESLADIHWLRRIIAPISAVWAKYKNQSGSVVVLDDKGNIIKRFFSEDKVTGITSAIPHQGKVYFGFLHGYRTAVAELQR